MPPERLRKARQEIIGRLCTKQTLRCGIVAALCPQEHCLHLRCEGHLCSSLVAGRLTLNQAAMPAGTKR